MSGGLRRGPSTCAHSVPSTKSVRIPQNSAASQTSSDRSSSSVFYSRDCGIYPRSSSSGCRLCAPTSPRNLKVDGHQSVVQPGEKKHPAHAYCISCLLRPSSEFTAPARPAKSNSLHRRISEVRDATVMGANHRTNTVALSQQA